LRNQRATALDSASISPIINAGKRQFSLDQNNRAKLCANDDELFIRFQPGYV